MGFRERTASRARVEEDDFQRQLGLKIKIPAQKMEENNPNHELGKQKQGGKKEHGEFGREQTYY